MKVMLIAETNWLENIALAQDSAAAYLLDMADAKKIVIAVVAMVAGVWVYETQDMI